MKKSNVSFPEDMLLPKEQYKEDKMSDIGQQLQSVVFSPQPLLKQALVI